MHALNPRRIRRRGPWLAALVVLVVPAPSLPRLALGQDVKSSYDQVTPVLLGKETFQDVMAKDKADKAGGHGPAEEAAGGALRPRRRARRQGEDDPRQADPGRPDGPAAGGHDLGAAGRDDARRDPREGPVPQGLPAAAAPQARGRAAWSSRRWRSSSSPRLERFDLDFDLPEHFLPEFPPAIFLTTRPDLGDVSQGKVVTVDNFQEIFAGHPQRQGPGRPAAAGHAVPAAAVQRHRRPQDRAARRHAGRGLLRLPRQRPHLGGDPPGRATSGRSRTAAASTRRACAASTSSGCSARSGR